MISTLTSFSYEYLESRVPRLNREFLPHISRASGVNVVASTALYYDRFMSEEHKAMTVEEVWP